jgi:hypothetical protein
VSVRPFLSGRKFDPETIRLMGIGFEMVRVALRLGQDDLANQLIAQRIIELANAGERDPDVMCDAVVEAFSEWRL